MIVVIGHQGESMIESVCQELGHREVPFTYINNADIPGTVSFSWTLGGSIQSRLQGSFFGWSDGRRLESQSIQAVYHRLGFSSFEAYQDYAPRETEFVSNECALAVQSWLNCHPGKVVNRPRSSGSNASKPYQVALFAKYGLYVPYTLVTNQPEVVKDFYEVTGGRAIYKSISYVRSIVQRLKPEDFERLDTLANSPIQLQEEIEGFDVRVHVVGERVFASRIESEDSDYRYDKNSNIVAYQLDSQLEEICRRISVDLELPLVGIDLRIQPDGQVTCFEANPSPAFTWYEARTQQPITAALCDLLTADRS